MEVIDELKTGKVRNTKNKIVQELIVWLTKYEFLERDEFTEIDDIFLRELIEKNYLKIDLDEDGNTIVSLDKPTESFKAANTLFLNSTNKYMDKTYSNRYGKVKFYSNLLLFYGGFDELIFQTSLLTDYKLEDGIAKFSTLNSRYEFKVIKELPIVELASEDEIEEVMGYKDLYMSMVLW